MEINPSTFTAGYLPGGKIKISIHPCGRDRRVFWKVLDKADRLRAARLAVTAKPRRTNADHANINMLAKKQINLTPKKISNWLTIIIIFLTMAVLILVSIFLYKNFYQTITQGKEILILQEKVSLYAVDMKKFNLIIDKLTKKTLPKKLDNIISPFR